MAHRGADCAWVFGASIDGEKPDAVCRGKPAGHGRSGQPGANCQLRWKSQV